MAISKELILKPYNGGVTFAPPDKNTNINYSLNDLLNFPIHVVLLNTESKIQAINEETIVNSGFPSIKKNTRKNCKNRL